MHTDARLVPGRVRLLSVQAPEDIEYLVKESEVLTGRSGRTFVIAGADRLVSRVHWQPLTESGGHAAGPLVERLGHHGEVLSRSTCSSGSSWSTASSRRRLPASCSPLRSARRPDGHRSALTGPHTPAGASRQGCFRRFFPRSGCPRRSQR